MTKRNLQDPLMIRVSTPVSPSLGRIVDWVAEAQAFADMWGIKLEDVSIEIDLGSYYNDPEINSLFTAHRPETPAEMGIRLEKHAKSIKAGKKAALVAKARKEEAEYAEFERLKKKFEPVKET